VKFYLTPAHGYTNQTYNILTRIQHNSAISNWVAKEGKYPG